MKLGLGTVQFGLEYGISNQEGKTSQTEVGNILSVAMQRDIRVIDTASLYGNSEEVVGKAIQDQHAFKVVTKTIRFDTTRIVKGDAVSLEKAFQGSLAKLRCKAVYGLLVHNANDLLAENGSIIYDSLLKFRSLGYVEKIGVSVYSSQQLDEILSRYQIDIVQLPLNILDQRLLHSGHLSTLRSAGIEIHVRSAFLQGLLLMDPQKLSLHFNSVRPRLLQYHAFLRDKGISPLEAALGFVCGLDEIDAVICGVNNHRQLEEICSSCNPLARSLFIDFAMSDASIVDPSNWVST